MGRGQGLQVVGGTVSVNITPEDVKAALFGGFFPVAPFDAERIVRARPSRITAGNVAHHTLPDPAVSKHLAAFYSIAYPWRPLAAKEACSREENEARGRGAGACRDKEGSLDSESSSAPRPSPVLPAAVDGIASSTVVVPAGGATGTCD